MVLQSLRASPKGNLRYNAAIPHRKPNLSLAPQTARGDLILTGYRREGAQEGGWDFMLGCAHLRLGVAEKAVDKDGRHG